MHNPKAPKEVSSLLIFVPVMALAVYLVYLIVTVPFGIGRNVGLAGAPHRVIPKDDGAVAQVFDHKKLVKPSADLIELGARVYRVNCASCHGAEGLGNGAAGLALAVKPRNFVQVANDWKNGSSVLNMYTTLQVGLGSMPNFPALNPEQKYAVIHFIHAEYMKNGFDQDSPEALAALPEPSGAVDININPYAETRIPVRMVMDRMAQEAPRPISEAPRASSFETVGGLGQRLYLDNCASCHGPKGQGPMPSRIRGSSPALLRQLSQGSALLAGNAPWAEDFSVFRQIVANGVPGTNKTGLPTLTEAELEALYNYTLSLR